MSAEILNLRLARKRKQRVEKEKNAEENRLKFGQSKTEKAVLHLEKQKLDAQLDQHQLSSTDSSEPDL